MKKGITVQLPANSAPAIDNMIYGFNLQDPIPNDTNSFTPFGQGYNTGAISNADIIVTTPCTVQDLTVDQDNASGVADNSVTTLYKNGTSTALQVTIAGAVTTRATNSANPISFAIGDTLAFKVVTSAAWAGTNLRTGGVISFP